MSEPFHHIDFQSIELLFHWHLERVHILNTQPGGGLRNSLVDV
jgi:hypothetical protein